MMRLTFSLAVLAAMLATSSNLHAQRRAPIRNMMRSIGHGWGTGVHRQTPGHDSSYYSAWSEHNTSQGGSVVDDSADGSIIKQAPTPAIRSNHIRSHYSPNRPAPINEENSASRLLKDSLSIQDRRMNPRNTTTTLSEQTRINQHLKPYYSGMINPNAIQIDQGGSFRITPRQTPADNTGWQK